MLEELEIGAETAKLQPGPKNCPVGRFLRSARISKGNDPKFPKKNKKSQFWVPWGRFATHRVHRKITFFPTFRRFGRTAPAKKRPPGAKNWEIFFSSKNSVHFLSKSVPIVKIGLRVNFLGPVEVWPFQPRFPAPPAPGKNPHFSTRFLAPCAQFYNSCHFLTSGARHQIFFLNES